MRRLRALAPAKVNLCLFLGPARNDGYHELVTLYESVSLSDVLVLTVLGGAGEDQVLCEAVEGPNLVGVALRALRDEGWAAPPVRIEIDKQIPVAAGLGGGSADAAATIRLARAIEPLPEGVAAQVARRLGADVPSQLEPGPSVGTGAGEQIEPVQPPAPPPHAMVIVPQPFGLGTADVYREGDRLGLPRDPDALQRCRNQLRKALNWDGAALSKLIGNDLEPAALSLAPPIAHALDAVRGVGAEHALVCGSGPTVIGLRFDPDCVQWAEQAAATLAGEFPGSRLAHPVGRGFGAPSLLSGTISRSA